MGTDIPVGSVSQLIAEAKSGDEVALADLHRRYWPELVRIAQSKLKGIHIPAADAEDVAQNAFISLHQNFKQSRVPDLETRYHLLAFLTHIVACLAVNEIKHNLTKKQGGGAVQNTSPLISLVKDDARTPLQRALLSDCYEFYIGALDDSLRPYAELHLAGLTNREIAAQLDCAQRTVERKLSLLRIRWQELASESLHRDVAELLRG